MSTGGWGQPEWSPCGVTLFTKGQESRPGGSCQSINHPWPVIFTKAAPIVCVILLIMKRYSVGEGKGLKDGETISFTHDYIPEGKLAGSVGNQL